MVLSLLNIPITVADPDISISLEKRGDKLVFHATDNSGAKINKVEIYKNGKIFYRAYSAKVNNLSPVIDKGVITFIFDDGWLDIFTEAYPVFEKYGKVATIAIIKGYVDKPGGLSSKHISRLVQKGWDVVAHATRDKSLLTMTRQEQDRELSTSRAYLWKNFWATNFFIYPFGEVDEVLVELTKKYYQAGRGYEQGFNKLPVNPFDIKIISLEKDTEVENIKNALDRAEKEKLWLVFVGHHVSTTAKGQYTLGSEKLDSALDIISKKNLKVVTLNQALQELGREISPIQDNRLHWEFDKSLVGPIDVFYVVVNDKRSKLITSSPPQVAGSSSRAMFATFRSERKMFCLSQFIRNSAVTVFLRSTNKYKS